jgi:hypothetical protein
MKKMDRIERILMKMYGKDWRHWFEGTEDDIDELADKAKKLYGFSRGKVVGWLEDKF